MLVDAAGQCWHSGVSASAASGADSHALLHSAQLEGTRRVRCLPFHSLWMDTMNRCIESRGRALLLACAVLAGLTFLPASQASAQGIVREAPKDVVRGRLVVTAPPQVTIDGMPDRLSPGARIRGLNNLLVMSASIVGQDLPVVYRRDAAGLVHEVWVLTPEEYARLRGTDSLSGHQRFSELLSLIFGARR